MRMPLTMAAAGDVCSIKKIGGAAETKQFLSNLGFVVGSSVTVVSAMGGNLIVLVKDARVALSREMACKILV